MHVLGIKYFSIVFSTKTFNFTVNYCVTIVSFTTIRCLLLLVEVVILLLLPGLLFLIL